ncbi:MAG TPA: ABC transporter permease [Thermoanaerobaculia bacterium]|nr:ABC transporter permease [Thermoanaerobaculia bacterium]
MRSRTKPLRWAAPAIALGALAAWETGARLGIVPTLFFPAPSRVFLRLAVLAQSGELFLHFGATLSRMLVALAWGGGSGLALGMALGYSPRLRMVVDPFIAAFHPVPKMALLPLIMLIFGIGFFSKVLLVAISAFFPMVINTMSGVLQLDPNYFDVARLHGASRRRIFWRIVLPGSLPMTLAGARLAMNRALGATIAMELITAQNGLGSMLFVAWQTYRSEELYATIFVIALFGYLFRRLTTGLAARLVPWQAGERPG